MQMSLNRKSVLYVIDYQHIHLELLVLNETMIKKQYIYSSNNTIQPNKFFNNIETG